MDTGSARRAAACLGLGAIVVGTLSACSQQDSSGAAASPTSGPTSAGSSSPDADPTSQGTAAQRPSVSPLAPATVKPVIRNGVRPHPSISARPAPFDQSVVYPDGVELAVTGIHQGRVTGQGPGVVKGPKTTFDLRFTNGSTRAISLDQVVPTAEFGTPARVAAPVYDARTQDFGTTVAPGRSATARYAFSIPPSQLGDVTIHLDFDGRHYAASFQGSAAH